MPCSLVAMEGTVCTPSSRPSSSAPAAWPGSCGGIWAGNVPSSATAVQGLWPAPVWSLASVGGGRKKNVFENQLDSRRCVSSSSCTPSAPGCANLCIQTQRGGFSVTRSRTRMENIFMGHELDHFSSTIAFSQQLPLYYRWDGCSSSCPSRLCVPEGTRQNNIRTLKKKKKKLCYHKKIILCFEFFLPEPRNKNRNVTFMKTPANVKCYTNGKVCYSHPANVAKTHNQITDQKPK